MLSYIQMKEFSNALNARAALKLGKLYLAMKKFIQKTSYGFARLKDAIRASN